MNDQKVFVTVAFRYGEFGYTLPIGVFATKESAEEAGKRHSAFRGGKYSHRIYEFEVGTIDDDEGHRVNNKPCF